MPILTETNLMCTDIYFHGIIVNFKTKKKKFIFSHNAQIIK